MLSITVESIAKIPVLSLKFYICVQLSFEWVITCSIYSEVLGDKNILGTAILTVN